MKTAIVAAGMACLQSGRRTGVVWEWSNHLRNRRVTVMGLGRHGGGVAAARHLASQGARVTVTDLADEAALDESLAALAGVPIDRYRLGEHHADDFRGADMVVANPAVPLDDPWMQLARRSGAVVTSEIELFIESCPAPIVGVTGSNGKSTTSAMIAAILEADGRRTWLGGNIGRSLLPELEWTTPNDWIVLELSSFQLAWLNYPAAMPHVAVITGFAANHLDWHRELADYRQAKQRILTEQTGDDLAILNTEDAEARTWMHLVRGEHVPLLPDEAIPPLRVPGSHNRRNARCAAAAALATGCSLSSIERGLALFAGLAHRLELVAEVDGRRFYNDSMATTPESVMAGLAAMDRPTWLLAGGKDKGTAFDALGEAIARLARGACFYGAARDKLWTSISAGLAGQPIEMAETLPEALRWCWDRSQPGESILLSPACSSYDQFRDYIDRAECFVKSIRALSPQPAASGPLSPSASLL